MPVRIVGKVFKNAGDLQIETAVRLKHLVGGVFFAEIFFSRRLAEQHAERLGERRLRVSGDERNVEDLENIRLRKKQVVFHVPRLAPANGNAILQQPGRLFDVGKIIFQQRRKRRRQVPQVQLLRAVLVVKNAVDPPNAVGVWVVLVEAQFIGDENGDEHANRQPKGQSCEVEDALRAVLAEGAEGYFEVVLEHGEENLRKWLNARASGERDWFSRFCEEKQVVLGDWMFECGR